ncbi:hypothetical protein [Alkaliphilus sp. B6464]|uniref:hypothetical protein n=1 Tax=Alkaliphilus sp. B6464 TaxID=2731219 RepID=UPI001BAE2F8A|nr:hypothetical protein [Alkaliphilus sp. B6464]QUH21737.1 hypothetical protein HYG84_17530 [Alkaliphilus sp. B6464]
MAKYHNGNACYEMKVDKIKKIFHLKASGFFAEEDGQSYLKDYDQLVKTFPTKDYVLVIDGTDLKPSSPKVAEMLGTLLERYIKIPFKTRFLITQGNAVTVSQFRRLGGQIPGWTEGVQYAKDLNEVIMKIS